MTKHCRSRALWLAILALTLLAASAFGQVPQDMTYTGRLVDNLGDPLAGPVNLELRIFDAAAGGTQLYSEQHLGVALDTTGGFSVQLGLGTSPSGTFDAALFSEVDRWLEVVVGAEVLTPRQIIGSVPWALVAEQSDTVRGFEIVSTGPLDLYVDDASGDDGNDGLTPATAKQTIQAAIDAIPPVLTDDAHIHVAAGTYNERIIFMSPIHRGLHWIHLQGNDASPETVIIDGSSLPPAPIFDDGVVVYDALIEISGITVQNSSHRAVQVLNNTYLMLHHCRIVNNLVPSQAALRADRNAIIDVSDCIIADNCVGIVTSTNGQVEVRPNVTISNNGSSPTCGSSGEPDVGVGAWHGGAVLFRVSTGECTLENNDLYPLDHSTIMGWEQCTRVDSTCIEDPSDPTGRCSALPHP